MTADSSDDKLSLFRQQVLLSVYVWQAPLGVRSGKRRHQSPEWTILSHVNCFIQGEVFGFCGLLNSLHPCSMKRPCGRSVSSTSPKWKLLRSFWRLFCLFKHDKLHGITYSTAVCIVNVKIITCCHLYFYETDICLAAKRMNVELLEQL